MIMVNIMTLFVSNLLILSVPDDHGQHHDLLTMIIRYTQDQNIGNKQSHDVDHDHQVHSSDQKIGNKQSHDVDHDHQVHSRSKDWKQTKSSVPDDHGQHHDFVCFQSFDLEST
jgi:hypothetical protein